MKADECDACAEFERECEARAAKDFEATRIVLMNERSRAMLSRLFGETFIDELVGGDDSVIDECEHGEAHNECSLCVLEAEDAI